MKTVRRQNLLAAALACALALTTAHAQQVTMPKTAAEVSGPAPVIAMTKEYVQIVGRITMLTDYIKLEQDFVACSSEDVIDGMG